jgi:hypothetical protein
MPSVACERSGRPEVPNQLQVTNPPSPHARAAAPPSGRSLFLALFFARQLQHSQEVTRQQRWIKFEERKELRGQEGKAAQGKAGQEGEAQSPVAHPALRLASIRGHTRGKRTTD